MGTAGVCRGPLTYRPGCVPSVDVSIVLASDLSLLYDDDDDNDGVDTCWDDEAAADLCCG